MRGIKSHLSFANVMVVVLAFVVLGGGAWAAKTGRLAKNSVRSKTIKNRSIQSIDVNQRFRPPYFRISGTVGRSKAGAAKASARSIFEETAPDTAGNLGSRVNVSAGAVEAFMTSPPFTFSLGCGADGALALLVMSTSGGWRTSSAFGTPLDANQTVQVTAAGLQLGEFRIAPDFQQTVVSANGQATTLNVPSIGREADGTCWIQGTAAGTTPTP